MNSTYAQKSSPVQKAADTKAASVLDSSAQSESLQRKADMANNAAQRAEAPRPNNTGMPDNLKAGIESLSGFSMDNVRVHYNSSKPATVQALAYTQGTDIHVAPGQEKCLPHEAWHVAQQMAGRVSPTTNINGMPVNDNAALEHEADVMGEKAVQCKSISEIKNRCCVDESNDFKRTIQQKKVIQRVFFDRKRTLHVSTEGKVLPGETDIEKLKDVIKKVISAVDDTLVVSDIFFEGENEGTRWNEIVFFNGRRETIGLTFTEIWEDYKSVLLPIKIEKSSSRKKTKGPSTSSSRDTSSSSSFEGFRFEKNKGCVVEALSSLGEKTPQGGDTPVDWHSYSISKGIDYRSDTGAFLLCTNLGFKVVTNHDVDLDEELTFIGDGFYLATEKGFGTEHHMIAVKVDKGTKEVLDCQSNTVREAHGIVVKRIYKKI